MSRSAANFAVVACIVLATVVAGGCGAAGNATAGARSRVRARPPAVSVKTGPVSRGGSFLSLLPACGCGRRNLLERFSLANGRRLGALARLPGGLGVQLSLPHASEAGSVWVTISRGPKYRSGVAGGDPAPDSCSGTVVRLNPATWKATTVMRIPRAVLASDTVPSPNGRIVVMVLGGCATSFFNEHLLVENLVSGKRFTLGAGAAPCHALSDVAWNPGATQLVFPYGPSALSSHSRFVPHGTCSAPRFSRLVVVSALHATPIHAWHLIVPNAGCSYQRATFDRLGLAAIEECTRGHLAGRNRSPGLGATYLVQLNAHRREIERLRLAPGYDGGDIAADPVTGTVLVSEYQAANQGFPVYDWVWAFDGHTLRTVHRYPNQDAATVIAEPW